MEVVAIDVGLDFEVEVEFECYEFLLGTSMNQLFIYVCVCV